MNLYGLWVEFEDGSNLFYDPRDLELKIGTVGNHMPNEFFFTKDLEGHQETVVHLVQAKPGFGEVKFHLTELRPQDPDYSEVHRCWLASHDNL